MLIMRKTQKIIVCNNCIMPFAYEFPVTQSANTGGSGNLGVNVGQVIVNAGTTDTNKKMTCNVPIGFSFSGNVSVAGANTFTVSNMTVPTICNVWKNGTFLTTTPVSVASGGSVSTKAFALSATTGAFNLNSYFYNCTFSYTPSTTTTNDTYTFYIPVTYTLNGTSAVTVASLPGCYPAVVVATTVATKSFSANISYSGSTDTTGYTAYSLTNGITYNNIWNAGSGSGYIPSYPNTTWNGLQECDIIYSNTQYVCNNINFKNTSGTNYLRWLNTDAGSASVLGSIASNLVTNSMDFISNLAGGFTFRQPVSVTGTLNASGIISAPSFIGDISSTNVNVNNLNVAYYAELPNNTLIQGDHYVYGLSNAFLRRSSLQSLNATTTYTWTTLREVIVVNSTAYNIVLPNPTVYPNPWPYATGAEGIYVKIYLYTGDTNISATGGNIRVGTSDVASWNFTTSGATKTFMVWGSKWCLIEDK